MTELNNVNLFGAMEHHSMVLFTVIGVMANQMTGQARKTVLNFTTMAGMIWPARGITTTCARDLKVSSSLNDSYGLFSRIIHACNDLLFVAFIYFPNQVLITNVKVFGTCFEFWINLLDHYQ